MRCLGLVIVSFVLLQISGCASADAVLRHESQGPPTPPPMPKFYTVSGTIELPYAEISEPFSAYVDNEKQLSRIDYYSGMVQSFNFANASHSGYLLHPVSTETEKNKRDCYQLAGVYNVQNVLPDASYFTYSRAEEVRGVMCNVFVNKTVFADKVNTYTLWVGQKDNRPYRYDMIGYDSLLGSHYDRYYVEYMEYDDKTRPQAKDFEVKAPKTCHPAPPSDGVAALNPLSELVSGGDHRSVDAHFQRFQTVHRRFKPYDSQVEERRRTHAFRQNLRYIHSKNRAGLPYKLAVNHLADQSRDELRTRSRCRKSRGGVLESAGRATRHPFTVPSSGDSLPDNWDWRILGGVSPVKDQGICGSCWSFGAAGVLEGAYFVKTGKRVRFSQQQLVDCSWGFGNNGCNGGEDVPSYSYMQKHGLAFEEDYGPYLMQDAYCHAEKVNSSVNVTGYIQVPPNNITAMKAALFHSGPISVSIDASHLSFVFYSSGVYFEPACSSTDLDHSVLAVGYGVLNGEPYWLVKNSWSFYWGNNGYVLMSTKNNNCGVTTDATFPTLA
ncbi:hypothetical protein BOX15_Mlig029086g5 [Macrostomum lignano]|uniref:Uncharacterized protein n=2 Tax=Macrostomum lignano TaxID=282301 RepID=A0A267DNL2_9PLAT|nr:hypothetical protein BOX15_Mlig029086g5 [Macrostomum lignano]